MAAGRLGGLAAGGLGGWAAGRLGGWAAGQLGSSTAWQHGVVVVLWSESLPFTPIIPVRILLATNFSFSVLYYKRTKIKLKRGRGSPSNKILHNHSGIELGQIAEFLTERNLPKI